MSPHLGTRGVLALVLAALAVTAAACTSAPAAQQAGPATPTMTSSKPSATKTPATVSGAAMPKGDLDGWHQLLADDFTGTELRHVWTTYSGQPGGDPAGWWDASHVVVDDGQLHLRTYRDDGKWVSGGVGAWNGAGLTYGKVEVRMRAPKAKGVAYAMLLWPAVGQWPTAGEIDFAEDGGGDRSATTATLHYRADNQQLTRTIDADFGTWQTVGVEWTPDTLVYTLNGTPWATVRSSGVPSGRMVLAMQSQVWGCHIRGYSCPDGSTPASSSVDVDWVVAYERVPD